MQEYRFCAVVVPMVTVAVVQADSLADARQKAAESNSNFGINADGNLYLHHDGRSNPSWPNPVMVLPEDEAHARVSAMVARKLAEESVPVAEPAQEDEPDPVDTTPEDARPVTPSRAVRK